MDKGLILLHRDFNKSAVESILKNKIKRVGIHLNIFQGTVSEFVEYINTNRALIDLLENEGVTVDYHLHAVGSFLPEMTAHNQELFRMNESGKRVNDYNLCPSSTEGLKIVEDGAEKLARALKQRGRSYYFWTDDDMGGSVKCHCKRCEGLSFAQQNAIIYRAILKGIRRYDPNARLSYLIYGEEDNCKNLPDGTFALFAPFKRRHDLPITAEENSFYKDAFLKLIEEHGSQNVEVLEYFLSYNYLGFCADDSRVKQDLKFYTGYEPNLITTFTVFPCENYLSESDDRGITNYFLL